MKLSDNKVIAVLNNLSTVFLFLFIIVSIFRLFGSGAPKNSKSVAGFQINNLIAAPRNPEVQTLNDWFSKTIIVSQTNLAAIDLRIKKRTQLYSWPSAIYQIAQLFYWLLIAYLVLALKLVFSALKKDKVFTPKNTYIILSAGVVLIFYRCLDGLDRSFFSTS
ncbi:hypothetical protein ABIB40_002766 [Pedobacter sp. UYP30]|uniref:hypothetical protein n=1 Tax=Pedobacter sp. UYP30 TaxID=1756400 RepID=UPI0033969AD0